MPSVDELRVVEILLTEELTPADVAYVTGLTAGRVKLIARENGLMFKPRGGAVRKPSVDAGPSKSTPEEVAV
jgi:hypothetical protein